MNAHISLGLGIAAAAIMKGKNIKHLKSDFDQINQLLSSLVGEVEKELSAIWPTLKLVLKWTRKVDDFMIGFGMEITRDGAWRFANELSEADEGQFET